MPFEISARLDGRSARFIHSDGANLPMIAVLVYVLHFVPQWITFHMILAISSYSQNDITGLMFEMETRNVFFFLGTELNSKVNFRLQISLSMYRIALSRCVLVVWSDSNSVPLKIYEPPWLENHHVGMPLVVVATPMVVVIVAAIVMSTLLHHNLYNMYMCVQYVCRCLHYMRYFAGWFLGIKK